jgi:D-3-phosphoglycerate dehydrogenase / 2-oxoglutarate reductase
MPKVLIADKLEAAGIDILTHAGIEVDNRPGLTGAELKAALQGADAAIVRSAPKVTADILEAPGRLKAIARAGVGVDNIDVPAATRKGIVVMNTPGGNTVSAAEHTIALMTALARHIPVADGVMKQGKWDRNKFVGTQLTGKTIGVIGLGRIGREVAQRAIGLGMTVVGFDPFVTQDKVREMGYEPAADVAAMLPVVDFLTVHVPLTKDTTNLIGAAELGRMKKTARVLNVARGGIIDEVALAEALKAGTIAGAGIDVFTVEPPAADHPLRSAPNCIVTPHLGASTVEAQENVALEAATLIRDFLLRGVVANAVNMAAVDRAELEKLRQFVDLSYRLGRLQAQMAQGSIGKVSVTYKGDLADQKVGLLTSSFMAGLLEGFVDGVNLVNAELLARDRGIEIETLKQAKKGDFASAMQTEVFTDKKCYTATGTLFGDQYVRLVQLGDFRLEAYLDGTLVIFSHHDKPGLIGYVGTLFGKHHVNIAGMVVGRQTPGGEAIGVLNVDTVPGAAAIAEMTTHEHITSVSTVTLPKAGQSPPWLG